MTKKNRRIVLARRPDGEPEETDFRLEETATRDVGSGQVLVCVFYISPAPYMRGRMREEESYAPPVTLGEVMTGGSVDEVVASNYSEFVVGDIVSNRLYWQEYGLGVGMVNFYKIASTR